MEILWFQSVPVSHGWILQITNERDDPLKLVNLALGEIHYIPFLILKPVRDRVNMSSAAGRKAGEC